MSDPVEIVLSSTFHGLNRVVSETDMNEAESPDCTDCCNAGRKVGQLGPRLGRQRFSTHTYPLLGLGMLVGPMGRFKLIADTHGDWSASAVTWAGVTPATPLIAVTNASRSSTTATLTSTRHGLTVGAVVTVNVSVSDYNGTFTILTVPTVDTFTYTMPNTGASGAVTGTVTSGLIAGKDTAAGVRFVQYGTRIIAYNGKNRPMTFNGNRWENLGILGGVDYSGQFTPTITLGGGTTARVNTASANGTKATLTTDAAHGFIVGQSVTVNVSDSAFNGTFIITDVTTTTFKYLLAATIGSKAVIGTAAGPSGSGVTGSSSSKSGTTITITTTTAHGFATGQLVTFVSNKFFNGVTTAGITVTGANTFTFDGSTSTPTVTTADYTTYPFPAGEAPTITAVGVASGVITGTYYYYVVPTNTAKRDITGRAVEGLPSNRSAVASPSSQSVTIGAIPATHPDSQVNGWSVYRSTNGGFDTGLVPDFQDFYYVATVALGTTSYVDTRTDADISAGVADTSVKLRFTTNIPPTFKISAVYGDRVFGAGFDPISSSTVTTTEGNATVTLATGTWPDGIKGCFFQQANDDGVYTIKSVATNGVSIVLDRVFNASTGSIAGGTKGYTIYRNSNEIWFSDYQNADGWGKDGEYNRLKLPIPFDKSITGLFPFQGNLLVFTATEIWAIYGRGTSRFDIKKLTDACAVDAGAVSQDTIFRSGNECHFLTLDGPASIDSVGTSINVTYYGTPLNTDWLDSLTAAETQIACAGTDGRAIWYSVPSAAAQTLNSKTFRFELNTKGWFEETEMCPLRFVRQDGTDGQIQQLFFLQDRFVMKPQTGTLDLVSAAITRTLVNSTGLTVSIAANVIEITVSSGVATFTTDGPHGFTVGQELTIITTPNVISGTENPVASVPTQFTFTIATGLPDSGPTSVTGVAYVSILAFPTTSGGLEQNYVRIYKGAVSYSGSDIGQLLCTRRIISNTAYSVTWVSTSTLPGSGNNQALRGDTIEIGNIGWKWLSKATLIPGHRKLSSAAYVTYTEDANATIQTNDVIDGNESTNQDLISCANKVESKVGVDGSNQIYQMRLASRNGAILQDVTLKSTVDSDIV